MKRHFRILRSVVYLLAFALAGGAAFDRCST